MRLRFHKLVQTVYTIFLTNEKCYVEEETHYHLREYVQLTGSLFVFLVNVFVRIFDSSVTFSTVPSS